jgi:tetraacyldisaccharide 4'-kinase
VISVGNLSVGGSGKTPVVAALARLLVDMGERPAILSRGYARARLVDGVVVASDGERVLEPVERTGDEPQMLARSLRGVPVLVCPDRHLAGRLAERRFRCTVILLDDGFQHLSLGREIDLVLMPASDLSEDVLPSGRLREGLDAACSADCLLVPGSIDDVARVSSVFEGIPVFNVVHRYAPIRPLDPNGDVPHAGARVVAVAGIARPERFFRALRERGYEVAREVAFPDHHWFTATEVDRIRQVAREVGADGVVTTEKDAVRLSSLPGWAAFPLEVTIQPSDPFRSWLRDRL